MCAGMPRGFRDKATRDVHTEPVLRMAARLHPVGHTRALHIHRHPPLHWRPHLLITVPAVGRCDIGHKALCPISRQQNPYSASTQTSTLPGVQLIPILTELYKTSGLVSESDSRIWLGPILIFWGAAAREMVSLWTGNL
eukprot:COSAG02_NODE_1465_length_12485_cov_9.526804_10_plen_139_part_00